MSLKQHNEIVQKLIKELDKKDTQIQSLKKQLHKANTPLIPKISSVPDKQANKKITQLHKQYKQKIDGLTQQIRSKSNENKDLKIRLNTKKNQEAKEKDQIAEVLKKTANISAYDPKFAAVVSHYETQIERKDKHISNLQRQIKQNYYKLQEKGEITRNQYNSQNEEENENIQSNVKIPKILNDEHYHKKYQQEICCLKNENAKFQRLFSQKSKQFKDLTRKYSELTKEYYKIINEYGGKEPANIDSDIVMQKQKMKVNTNSKAVILDNMLERFDIDENSELSYSFLSNMNTNNNGENVHKLTEVQTELERLENILSSIIEILGIENRVQVIPTIVKMKSKIEEFGVHENISKFMHSMLYRLGRGKVPMSEMIEELQKLENRIEKCQQSSDLLDQICFEVGAKKQRVEQKIKDLKATQDQFFNNMKDVNFMKQLPKANKVVEFIEYFELDAEICDLPDQLKKMYEQLKYVDRFMKQSLVILERQPTGLEKTLQIILRFLERKTADESLQVQDKPKKSGKTMKSAFQLDA